MLSLKKKKKSTLVHSRFGPLTSETMTAIEIVVFCSLREMNSYTKAHFNVDNIMLDAE